MTIAERCDELSKEVDSISKGLAVLRYKADHADDWQTLMQCFKGWIELYKRSKRVESELKEMQKSNKRQERFLKKREKLLKKLMDLEDWG